MFAESVAINIIICAIIIRMCHPVKYYLLTTRCPIEFEEMDKITSYPKISISSSVQLQIRFPVHSVQKYGIIPRVDDSHCQFNLQFKFMVTQSFQNYFYCYNMFCNFCFFVFCTIDYHTCIEIRMEAQPIVNSPCNKLHCRWMWISRRQCLCCRRMRSLLGTYLVLNGGV